MPWQVIHMMGEIRLKRGMWRGRRRGKVNKIKIKNNEGAHAGIRQNAERYQ